MVHLWHYGWSIVDVTNPTKPEVVKLVAGPDNTWTIQMEVSGNRMITALEKIAPGWGGDPNRPNDEGVLIWDISEPVDPNKLGQYKTGGTGTHRNFYAGGKYMHLAAGMPGYKDNIYVIVTSAIRQTRSRRAAGGSRAKKKARQPSHRNRRVCTAPPRWSATQYSCPTAARG